jgi:excisionase family DNA binding protein
MEPRKLTSRGREDPIDGSGHRDARGDELGDDRPLPRLLDAPTLADHLAVPLRHVRRLVHEDRVPYLKLGRLVRFDPADISAWLEQARRSGNDGSREP